MKKLIKISLLSFVFSLFIIIALFFCINKINDSSNEITVFQVGVYKNIVNANKVAKDMGGIVYKDNGLYRVYIAAYKNEDVILKMQKYYDSKGINYYLKTVRVDNDYINILTKYENMLQKSSDSSIYGNLNELLVSSLEEYL